jgi:hypothetical protein
MASSGCSLDTAVRVGGELRAGVAWFAVAPKINGAGAVKGHVQKQGYLALAGNNLMYPAIAMLPSGQGAIAFTVVGRSNHPSAAAHALGRLRSRPHRRELDLARL